MAQLLRQQLRVAAPQVEAASAFRQSLVLQRGELHQPGSQLLQQLQAVGIVEAECLVPGYRDDRRTLYRLRQVQRPGVQVGGGGGQGQQAVQIHGLLRLGGQLFQLLLQARHLVGGDQAQVAALQRTVGQAGQEPVHRDAGLGLYTFLQPGVEHGGHPVEDHAPDAAVRPEGFQAVDHGGQGESAPPAVHHQHRRGAGGFGQMVGAGLMAHGDAVVVAHDSLDEGQAGPHAVVLQQGPGAVLP